jgi:hypothetical protein
VTTIPVRIPLALAASKRVPQGLPPLSTAIAPLYVYIPSPHIHIIHHQFNERTKAFIKIKKRKGRHLK